MQEDDCLREESECSVCIDCGKQLETYDDTYYGRDDE